MSQRIRFILWLCLHDRVLTNSLRVDRDLAQDDSCGICSREKRKLFFTHCVGLLGMFTNGEGELLPQNLVDPFDFIDIIE